jgi:hypothetical protein
MNVEGALPTATASRWANLPARLLESLSALPPAALLGGSAVLIILLSLWEMREESATYDEPAHLAAAYVPLRLGDYRLLSEQPPLGRRIAAIPLIFESVNLPTHDVSWRNGDYFRFGYRFLYQSGNDADRFLFRARLAMMFWGLLLVATIYAAARELFGPAAGVVALVGATFHPLFLAHNHLVTTDVSVAALFLIAVIAFDRWLETASPFRTAAAGILLGGAVAVKFSALILIPVFGVLALRAAARAAWATPSANMRAMLLSNAALQRTLSGLSIGAVAYVTLWAAYGFRFSASPEASSFHLTERLYIGTFPDGFLRALHRMRAVPEAFLCGLAELRNHTVQGHPTFALGQHAQRGWWWYFPLAFVVKTPACLLALIAFGMGARLRLPPDLKAKCVTLVVPLLAVVLTCMLSSLNLGLRHFMPALPFLLVLAGAPFALPREDATARVAHRAVPWLLVGLVIECLAAAPYFLPYFNIPSLALGERHQILGDSNLDWGQDLGRLKRYLTEHRIGRIKLAYQGMSSPRHLQLAHAVLSERAWYCDLEPEWELAGSVAPGDYVAVSVSYLSGQGEGRVKNAVRGQPMLASVGHSIRVYRIYTPVPD